MEKHLSAAGFAHTIAQPDASGGYGAVLVASKFPIELRVDLCYDDPRDGNCFVPFDVGSTHIGAALVPGSSSANAAKERFWKFLVEKWEPSVRSTPAILMGDLNIGLHYRDELGATFTCSEYMQQLDDASWTDGWIAKNRGKRPPGTWLSPKGRNPFRLDHAIFSPSTPKDHLPLTVSVR